MLNQVGLVANHVVPSLGESDVTLDARVESSPQINDVTVCKNRSVAHYCTRPLWSVQPFLGAPLQLDNTAHHNANIHASSVSPPPSLQSLPRELFQQISSDVSLEDQVALSESNKKIRWLSNPSLRKLEKIMGSIKAIKSLPEDARSAQFDAILETTSKLSPAVRTSLLKTLCKHLESLPSAQRHERLLRLDSHAHELPRQEKASVLGYLFIADILLSEPDANSLSTTINAQVTAGTISRITLTQATSKRVRCLSHSQQEQVLKIALSNGYPDIVRSFEIILKNASVSMSRKLNLLTANQTIDSQRREEGIFGWRDVLEAFVLLTLPFASIGDDDTIQEPTSILIPSLHFSFLHGHAETIRAFCEIVQLAGFPETDIVKLLSANNADGTPGFHMAFKHPEAENLIKTFVPAIKILDISDANKIKLLAAKNAYGIPAAHWAWKNEKRNAISAYSDVVLNSGLPAENMRELLAANAPLLGRIAKAIVP